VQTLNVGDRVLMKSRFLGPTCHSQEIEPVCPHCAAGNYALCRNQSAGRGPTGSGGGWGDAYTAHESEVWRVPYDDLNDDQVALIEPLACSVRAVLRRIPEPGERVLVLGCGMIGLGVVAALNAMAPQADVYALARYPQQIELARRWGATVLEGDPMQAATETTNAHLYTGEFGNRTMLGGFDVIYDCVGNDTTIRDSLRMTRAGGTVVIVGVHLHRVRTDLTPTWHQEVDLIGALAHGQEQWQGESLSTFELTARLIRDGAIETAPYVTHRFSLDAWRDAIRTATDKHSGAIKVVFDLDGERV